MGFIRPSIIRIMHKGVAQYIAKHSDRISELEVLREIMLSLPMEEEVK